MNQAVASRGFLEALAERAERGGTRTALAIRRGGKWEETSYAALHEQALRLSNRLVNDGVVPGDRISILSESRPEWAVGLHAALLAGGVVVPLDPGLTPRELAGIVAAAQPRLILASSRYADIARRLQHEASAPLGVLDLSASGSQRVGRSRTRASAETAAIVYTSGTTGAAKGVQITFRNLDFELAALTRVAALGPDDVFLSLLPLHHSLELTCGLLCVLYAGGQVAYPGSPDLREIMVAMAEREPTHVLTVPLFLKLLKAELERAGLAARHPSPCGRRLRCVITGGAPLDRQVEDFFERLGIAVCQGYGLTETGPVISVNTLSSHAPRSVGRPLPGVEVRIVRESGEILTRGPHVTPGYYGRDDLTHATIDPDGWLHTGDLGRLDEAGFLHVTGRLKNLIVLPNGKKVQPEEVEERLALSPDFLEVCVLGSEVRRGFLAGSEQVCAVIVPGPGLAGLAPGELEVAVRAEAQRLVGELAPYKRPQRIVVRREALPRSSLRKVRREQLADWLRADLAAAS